MIIGKIWTYFEESCLIIFFAFMTLMNFANVLSRYLLNMSISASEELIICIFVWMSMFGAATAYKRGAHFAMGLLAESAGPKFRRILTLLAAICSLIMIAVLFYYSFDMIQSQIASGQRTAALRMPVYYQGLAIPIGCIMIAIRVVQSAVNDFKKYSAPAAQEGR
jgi:TRAP-type C4-dicarboxylate transport system permease small subunit